MRDICPNCGEPIDYVDLTTNISFGPNGTSHARCSKVDKAHGREVTLASLSEEISELKRRVQELERIERHKSSIYFRVGGGEP